MPTLEKRERLKLPHIPIPKRPPAERIRDFGEVTLTYSPEQAVAEASRCVECTKPPCVKACPLHNPIKDWLVLTAAGRFLEAAHLSRTTSNMPEICGRICPQDRLCEEACIVGVKHPPVAIGAIEKFINEYAIAQEGLPLPEVAPPNGLRVAVVGSGPAGLACAEELVRRGYGVTVYEAAPKPGGLLRYGIPGFKLEKTVVDRRIDYLRRLGVEFRCSTRVGEDPTLDGLRRDGFRAVFLATGATVPKHPKLPGMELEGIEDALPFLIRNNTEAGVPEDDLTGMRVVVLGGGDTAMDCLRTARRLGAASVTCVYRRDEANMPGSRREVQAAKEEGVVFEWLKAPVRFLDNGAGGVRGIECVHMELGEPDEEGRRRPVPIEGSNFEIEADLVILAFGFDGSPVPAGDGPRVTPWGTYVVDEDGMTSIPGVFAGGDVVRGADLVTTALADGRRAAEAIHRYLQSRVGQDAA
ncbi:MAG: NAD(P)-dependent oxidoreductase [Armatimonadota bacterium]|nr:NAD(P)-dependent oxidoreductase [Armatimonadota bacterium]MDR7450515.1 NAD(P)-dependent oxidoreductase [Armatimonadota bacterium]MDR7466352.1 NAD(P)-dependent oxidoreductase [Armatimonadota bacterium]MDR7493073.1 NAD(P)-dependent oxidoreductase [Armatimonadota bacterium]MDR7498170.1 NAD(P)-dependent oxidoreductase [Armatimonadota bacterium]